MIFFSFCHFGVHQPFCYVVCEHLHNVDEGASYLPLFCYRPVSLITSVCRQNKKTLKVLYLNIFHNWLNSGIIKNVFFSCTELKEVSIVGGYVGEDAINYLVKNLSPNVEKLRLDILVMYVVGFPVKGYKIRYICQKINIL